MDWIKDFGRDETASRENLATRAVEAVAPNESVCPDMSFRTRLFGFLITCGLGIMMSILGTVFLMLGSIAPFAVLYSIGNVCTLLSTGFLIGPMRQLAQMIDPNRLIASIVFFVTLIATLVVAFATEGKGFLCLILVIIQFLAFFWYSISYIPFARDFIIKMCGSIFT